VVAAALLVFAGAQTAMGRRGAQDAAEQPGYSSAESRAKLVAIGRALQGYRLEHGVKPVAERRSFQDAGLPENPLVMAAPGAPWGLSGGVSAFRISAPRYVIDTRPNVAHFTFPYLDTEDRFISGLYATRGELFIVAIDDNYTAKAGRRERPFIEALVLRLNGDVDLVRYRPGDMQDLLSK
jgi:hypothetical protein